MDGSLPNKFTGEPVNRLFRPVTYEYACSNLPRLIVLLKQNKVQVLTDSVRDGIDIVRLQVPGYKEDQWVLLRSDFELVKKIALNSSLAIFQSDTSEIIQNRILAQVQVEFEDRKIP